MFFVTWVVIISAQHDSIAVCNQEYCVPALKGVPVGKGLSIEYQRVPNISITTKDNTGNFEDTQTTIKALTRLEVKLKVPIINRKNLVVLMGLKYKREEYHFENPEANPIYQDLEDRGLRSFGGNLTIIKPTKSKRFWILNTSGYLNGDIDRSTGISGKLLKFSISPAVGWKVDDDFSYAVGLTYNYRFGVPLLLPLLAINKNFNDKWGIEAILPVYVRSRYKINNGFFWINTIEVDGASYSLNIDSDHLDQYSNLYLHRSNIQLITKVEKHITNWIWASAGVGIRRNLALNLANSNQSNKNVLYESTLKPSFLFNVSLFVSPFKRSK